MSTQSADSTEARRDALAVGLLRAGIPGLVAAYRFGSSAAGTGRPGSDVDLAILTDHRLEPVARFKLQEQLASALHTDVDLVDLRAASTVMASQVVTTGILLYERDAPARHVFENFVYGRYARLNEERRGILERIAQEGTVYGG
ncbi:MAG: nucleotidyltransferase domain-containing protein [Acidobacteria bacterium]|nr:nucleotidyltransferase domain-containing protein [Acidobacteriota bacterium]